MPAKQISRPFGLGNASSSICTLTICTEPSRRDFVAVIRMYQLIMGLQRRVLDVHPVFLPETLPILL